MISQSLSSWTSVFVSGVCCVTNISKRYLSLCLSQEHRARSNLIIFFKAKARAIKIPLDDLIPVGRVTRHSQDSLQIPQSSVDSHLHSFFPSTIRLWNNLPQQIKACDSVASFRSKLQMHTIKQ